MDNAQCSAVLVNGRRTQYVYRFCDRCQTLSDDISITKMIHNKNSSDLSWGTVPQSIAGEFCCGSS